MAGWPEDVQVDPETGEDTDKEKGPTPGILGGRRQELNKAPEALADRANPGGANATCPSCGAGARRLEEA